MVQWPSREDVHSVNTFAVVHFIRIAIVVETDIIAIENASW